MSRQEIILYQPDEQSTAIDVRVEDETVWLNRHQIAKLFNRDIKTIGKHINNALKEELNDFSVIAKFATTANDGKTYQVEHYNLDMILSVGYRVKSKRGVQFRRWANDILKDFLLTGYAISRRLNRVEQKLDEHDDKIELLINTNLPANEGIFYDGQIFDAWKFTSELIKTANHSIILIDNYVDETVLDLFTKRQEKVEALIYTKTMTKALKTDLKKHNAQYPKITIKTFQKSHDRFLIIDKQTIYHIGASLKDLGKKWFAFSKMNLDIADILNKLESE